MFLIPLDGESSEYRKLREELLEAEIALKSQRERVAELRRRLPAGAVVEDLVLRGEGDREVRLSELFGEHASLIVYHFMFGEAQEKPCPMCTLWCDGFDVYARRIRERAGFAVCSAAPIADFQAWGRERGWQDLQLLSSQGSGFKTDFGSQLPDGSQIPVITVFTRDAEGTIRLSYRGSAILGQGEYRGLDLLCPVWNLFDLLPEGRADWMPSNA